MMIRTKIIVLLLLSSIGLGCEVDTTTSHVSYFDPPIDLRPAGLTVPTVSMGRAIHSCRRSLSWSESPNCSSYVVQAGLDPYFSDPRVVYDGPGRYYDLGCAEEYLWTWFYRVRAERPDSISEWSNIMEFP